ncbi:3-methyl-2-oxobutanoate hydroxymethyltransferase [Thermaerobacter subterraneus]
MASRVTVRTVLEYKEQGRPVVMVTAYDYPFARLADAAGVDMILVGDSLGNVVLGYPATVFVTLDEMVHHTRAARRGVERALLVADMPFLTFHLSVDDALRAAGRLVQEGGAEAVKLEGAGRVLEVVHRLTGAGIPVVGHLGLLPQRVHALGGYRVQGRDEAEARQLLDDAVALEQAGAFALVLEMVPRELAAAISRRLRIPTIGIGAGPDCDGQVLVLHDLLGLTQGRVPRFARRYAELGQIALEALQRYAADVRARAFPTDEHSYHMAAGEAGSRAGDAAGAPAGPGGSRSPAPAGPAGEAPWGGRPAGDASSGDAPADAPYGDR